MPKSSHSWSVCSVAVAVFGASLGAIASVPFVEAPVAVLCQDQAESFNHFHTFQKLVAQGHIKADREALFRILDTKVKSIFRAKCDTSHTSRQVVDATHDACANYCSNDVPGAAQKDCNLVCYTTLSSAHQILNGYNDCARTQPSGLAVNACRVSPLSSASTRVALEGRRTKKF